LRLIAITILVAGIALADVSRVPGILRGNVTAHADTSLTVATAEGKSWTCVLDRRTWMERSHRRIDVSELDPTESVEVVTDYKNGECYARLLRVLPPENERARRRRLTVKPVRTLDHIFPRGNLTFAGVVVRMNEGLMVLRTREEPELFVFLRDDTRFLNSGAPGQRSDLGVNTRVFVRAGKNVEQQTEAFQVIWGQIAGPHRTYP
jgi:hypothetical protein